MRGYATKVCPRCGEELFADMRVCYGCLYEFPAGGKGVAVPVGEASAAGDEELAAGDEGLPELREDEPFLWDAGLPPAEPTWEDDTLDLSDVGEAPGVGIAHDRGVRPSREILCLVRTPSVDVRLPIPEEGLVVGRDPASDVVLHSRAVSRSHVRILPAAEGGEGMRVVDLGATNPAMYRGREVRGEALVPPGWTVSVCGAFVTPIWSKP
ncbi:FHA domain-containing protein [Tractidigestivibacter sp.]|uniref:FHA domain-containing protein n=1 Tax=Tractidigestivibacter sp. TaxID=2847320 RepID=UPI002A91C355|nr:FHA domain-containing protein [Tractidigestivibacter sp.]MCI6274785.1 FHA domain-containing protein [Coriobacteriaceae bacterium]MDY5271922.1 FHA domain-containing protein [Tractidigestivibacter sp.]